MIQISLIDVRLDTRVSYEQFIQFGYYVMLPFQVIISYVCHQWQMCKENIIINGIIFLLIVAQSGTLDSVIYNHA